MEIVLALAIGVLTGSGVYILLRPRTFQVIMGLTLISYAVNLFIFRMGRLKVDTEPVLLEGVQAPRAHTAGRIPQLRGPRLLGVRPAAIPPLAVLHRQSGRCR